MARQAPPPENGSTPRTRKEKKEDTRERVRQAAYDLFSSVGFEATTTKAVADRAGVASGTVFVHAKDKTDLLCLVMTDLLREAVEHGFGRAKEHAALLDRLLAVFSAVFEMYGKNAKLALPFVRAMPGAEGPNGQVVAQITFEFLGRLAALVTEAQASGEIAGDAPPLLVAQNIFALYFFALFSWISGYVTVETALDPQLRLALELQLAGLRPRA